MLRRSANEGFDGEVGEGVARGADETGTGKCHDPGVDDSFAPNPADGVGAASGAYAGDGSADSVGGGDGDLGDGGETDGGCGCHFG